MSSRRCSLIASYLVGLDGQQVKMAPDPAKAILTTASLFLNMLLEHSRQAIEDRKIQAATRLLHDEAEREIRKRINGALITDVVIPAQYDLLVIDHEYLRWLAHQVDQLQLQWAGILYRMQFVRAETDKLLEWHMQAVEDGMKATSAFAGDSRRIVPQRDQMPFAANQRPEMHFTFTPR